MSLCSRAFMITWVMVMTGCMAEATTTISAEMPEEIKASATNPVPSLPPVIPTGTPEWNQHGESVNPSITPDGRYVVFASNTDGLTEKQLAQCEGSNGMIVNCTGIFLYDQKTRILEMVSLSSDGQPANGSSTQPVISADGRWIVFQSQATNLDGNPAGGHWGLFVHDRLTGLNQMINSLGGTYPTISADGRFVAYYVSRQVGWDILLYDQQTHQTQIVSKPVEDEDDSRFSVLPRLSPDGRWLAFWSWSGMLTQDDDPSCSRDCGDVFLYNLASSQLERIEVGEDMGEGMTFYPLSFSEDGRWLAFRDLIVDTRTGQAAPLCPHAGSCLGGILSGDGQWVAYAKGADVFIQNRQSGEQKLASVDGLGTPGNGEVVYCIGAGLWCATFPEFDLSHDARWVVFSTTASNLADHIGDVRDHQMCSNQDIPLHNCRDIYLHDFESGITTWVSRPYAN
jgi:Tol biopolymer transport system component